VARRATDWVDTRLGLTIPVSGQFLSSLLSGLTQEELRGATIVRTILTLGVCSETVAGAWGNMVIDLAIGIVSREAFAAGVVPDPVVDRDTPARGWMWRTQRVISQNGVGGQVVFDVTADIRGARKVENGNVFIVANSSVLDGTTFVMTVRGMVRLLMKLP